MIARYRFTTLRHQQALGASNALPFAVIVESKRYIYCIGLYMDGDESVSGQVLKHFPAVLKDRVANASRTASAENGSALDVLCREFSWNIRADRVESSLAMFQTIEQFAHRLFVKQVESRSSVPAQKLSAHHPLSIFAFDCPSVELATA